MPAPRVAVITGCGKRDGLGAEIARELARAGHIVIPCDISASGSPNDGDRADDADSGWRGLASLVDEISAHGGRATSLVGDVSEEGDVARLVDDVRAAYGRLDILVNNAAAPQGADYGDVQDVPAAAFDLVMRVNVRGTFLMSKAAVAVMRERTWGRVINISSVNAKIGRARLLAYATSKAAILGLTRSLAMDVARSGITVNAICPGPIRTSRLVSDARRRGDDDVEEALERRAAAIPVGRNGEPRDVAAMARFLCSDEAAFVTGQAINVDGGLVPI